jgi:hypothetical protein
MGITSNSMHFSLPKDSGQQLPSKNISKNKRFIDEEIINVISFKFEILYWMSLCKISACKLFSLQNLIDKVGQNKALGLFGHNSIYSYH